MNGQDKLAGQKYLRERVIDAGLCTSCGACVGLCPYFASTRDRTVLLHDCDRDQGRCFAFCPRTPTDLESLRRSLFDPADLTPELGALKGFHVTRAAEERTRAAAQHGGTVTGLISLALEAGLIDTAVLVQAGDGLQPRAAAVSDPAEVRSFAGSKFVAAPVVETFNQAAKGPARRIGLVATPCQALALAKRRQKPFPQADPEIDKLKLVIGLFCGWALSWAGLRDLLAEAVPGRAVLGLDIPPSKHHCLEVKTDRGPIEISLDQVLPCVREACQYCFDMTAEFSDLSVGSARLPEGWAEARSWNQVIVRTEAGQALLDLARDKGRLEFREVPQGNLERLKRASANKKRAALENLARKSGDPADLIYLAAGGPD